MKDSDSKNMPQDGGLLRVRCVLVFQHPVDDDIFFRYFHC